METDLSKTPPSPPTIFDRKVVALSLALILASAGTLLACLAAKPKVSPLFAAVESRKPERLAALLRTYGGEIDQKYFGRTPLFLAVINDRADMAEMLLGAGANVNARDAYGNTPLHVAVFCHRSNVVSMLLERGAGVNLCNRFGYTPLHVGAFVGAPQIIMQMLISHGADQSARDDWDRTASELAPNTRRFP